LHHFSLLDLGISYKNVIAFLLVLSQVSNSSSEQSSAGQSREEDSKIAGHQCMENSGTSPARMSFQNKVHQNLAADSKIAAPLRRDCNDKKAAREPGAQYPARGLFPVRLSSQVSLQQIGSARSNERGTFLQ
jgi:hypothetical protein